VLEGLGAPAAARVRRARRLLLALALATVLAASAVLFVWPREDEAGPADAVVVLSGAREPRLAKGLELMREGVAPTLVISDGRAPGWAEGNRLCDGGGAEFRVVCFRPAPYSTEGEAEGVARLARDERWRSLVVVTSRYHVTRSRMLFRRCTDAAVRGVAADSSAWAIVRNLPFEWAKLGYQLTVERDC
jgi:uncharacterized SAM-binding protein YcdF (DUF218 family)